MKKFKLIALLTLLIINSVVLADINTGLVAHWNFDGNASDISGNANHGIENGELEYVDGIIGKAAKFDGINDFIEIVPKSETNAIRDFSVSVWTYLIDSKTQVNGAKDRQYIFDGHSYSATTTTNDIYRQGFGLIYDGDTKTQEIHDFIYYGNKTFLEQNTRLSTKGKWVHHVFIRKGNKDYTYINGALIKSTYDRNVKKNNPLDMQHNWFIGTFSGNNPNYNNNEFNYSFYGMLDDMRIYNRAIDASDVSELYNAGLSVGGTVTSLGNYNITCKNETTGQLVDINDSKATIYDCEAKGLIVAVGDKVSILINGDVQ